MLTLRRPSLIVMVKEPRPCRVKTRLGRDIGMTTAAWWFRHQSQGLLHRLRDPRWNIVLAVSPDREGLTSRVWPADLPRIPQGTGDLGQRMRRCLTSQDGPAILIGADIPGVTRTHIAQAFRDLAAASSIVGPATDGGFWLVGLKHPDRAPRSLFANTRWSNPETLYDTLTTLPEPVARAATLSDVDTADDLRASSF